jgi:hypothetical protein
MAADLAARSEKGKCLYSVVAEEQPIVVDEQNQTTRRSAGKDVKALARRIVTLGG